MACGIQLNDIGTELRITVQHCDVTLDISTATSTLIILKKPSGTIINKTASFVTDGTDGLLQYTTIDGDIDTVGVWKIQAQIVTPTGSWKSDLKSFKVHRNL